MGWIELRPRRGAVIAQLGPKQLIEMFEVMGELEGCRAARCAPDPVIEQKELVAAHQACKAAAESDGPDAYYYANERFHYAIYAASHNSFLAAEARQLHRKLRVYRRLQLRLRNRVSNSFAEHDGIVAAILAGNVELTDERLRKHILIEGERFGDALPRSGPRRLIRVARTKAVGIGIPRRPSLRTGTLE